MPIKVTDEGAIRHRASDTSGLCYHWDDRVGWIEVGILSHLDLSVYAAKSPSTLQMAKQDGAKVL